MKKLSDAVEGIFKHGHGEHTHMTTTATHTDPAPQPKTTTATAPEPEPVDPFKEYRSLETIKAVQYKGDPIPDVTCSGTGKDLEKNGCDPSRRLLPHVHTAATGGMTPLRADDWIIPVRGGPFMVSSDAHFRVHWEVSEPPSTKK